jgi:hypothetical protein
MSDIVAERLTLRIVNIILNELIACQYLAGKGLTKHEGCLVNIKNREALDIGRQQLLLEFIIGKHFDKYILPKPQILSDKIPS